MQSSIFHKLSTVLWICAVTAVVLLATYVSMGRFLSTNLQNWQGEVLAELNSRVPFIIRTQRLRGEWSSFTPEIVLHGLELDLPEGDLHPLQLTGGRIGIDVLSSLATRSLQFTSLQLDGLALRGELTREGKFIIPGLTGGGGTLGAWLQEFLLNIEYITLENNSFHLRLPNGESREFDLGLHLARDGSRRHLRADLLSTAGTSIGLVGKGLGNPFRPQEFEGTLHMTMASGNLAAVADVFPQEPPAWADGELSGEVWLAWDRGEPELDVELALANARVRPLEGDWSVPLDELSLQATLVERRNRWTVYASDLRASHQGVAVDIPRLQLDTWGDSMRLRTAALQLEPINRLLLQMPGVPETLHSVFETLNLRGELSALQLGLGDITEPLASWDVEGNFHDLQVDSWRGAPGVTSGTGYFELSDAGGYVVMDSQQFTMAFPTIYRQPLFYDDFHGTLNLDWDRESLLLHSDVITATAAEGTAQALFSLNIPFSKTEVGLEMDLMVGLSDSHPIHRAKYIPYTLNPTLLNWLSGAVGEGDIEQAGFIWRGSLRPGASALRTVQLMLNVSNTTLSYHPDWPPVSSFRGMVLIDDTEVSVWSEHARLYDSVVEQLSAEAWLGQDLQMRLAIDGRVIGGAADGLRTVKESLLGSLTRGAFDDWTVQGALRTELQLELNLADKTVPPRVSVAASLADVDLLINPGRVPISALNGNLFYSSERGFSADDLAGELWQQPLMAALSQRNLRGMDAPFTFTESALEVALRSSVNPQDLEDWLSLDALAMASGLAEVEGLVTVIPGETPLLTLQSTLHGVALDLPVPWTKPADSELALEVALPLGGEATVLGLALGDDLSLQLDLTGGGLRAASLGVSVPPPELERGEIRVEGRAALVDVEAWLDFSSRYLVAGEAPGMPVPDPNAVNLAEDPGAAVDGLRLTISEAQAQRLLLWGQEYQDVRFSLDLDRDAWAVRGSTDWLQGEYRQPAAGRASLQLDYLDIATSRDTDVEQDAAQTTQGDPEPLDLPGIDVNLVELRLDGRSAGGLELSLESAQGEIRAENIVGDIAGMQLTAEEPGALTWKQGQGSSLALPLQFDDIGDTLDQLGYARFLETEQGRINLDLQWPGSPQDFSLVTLEGAVVLDLEAGRFLETPGGTGALKVVEILNLAGIVQRLSLSHMFESGLGFDTMDGELYFHGGTLEVADLAVRGSSSAFAMSGVSDIASRSLDGELVATLPVANNLPWVAALTAGPAVAAGVFVVSKVFEKQVNRLSSGVYTIEGNWDEPQVEFDRIFDDELRLASVPSAVDPNEPVAPEAVGPVEEQFTAPVEQDSTVFRADLEASGRADPNQPLP